MKKNKKSKKNKKNKMILISIIVLFVLLILMLLLYQYISENTKVDEKYTKKDLKLIDDQIDSYLEDKIVPSGLSKLYGNYKGDNDLNDIYRSIYSLVNYMPTLSKKIEFDNDESINKFYEKNKIDIKSNLGIDNLEDFTTFINYLNEEGYEAQKFIECSLDSSTFTTKGRYFSFNLKLNFEELSLQIKLNFANNSGTQPLVYYSIITNE